MYLHLLHHDHRVLLSFPSPEGATLSLRSDRVIPDSWPNQVFRNAHESIPDSQMLAKVISLSFQSHYLRFKNQLSTGSQHTHLGVGWSAVSPAMLAGAAALATTAVGFLHTQCTSRYAAGREKRTYRTRFQPARSPPPTLRV